MHLLAGTQLKPELIEAILDRAAWFKGGTRVDGDSKVVCTAFFEPSTRTRISFEAAALRLGWQVLGFSEAGTTSAAKGESLEDTVRVLSGYADVIVLRHPERGAARRAADVADVPVINAGDGKGEHPTQTLVDLFTIREKMPLHEARVAVVGDLLNGRTVHSLVPALEAMGASVVGVPIPGLGLEGLETVTIAEALATCNVIYMTRFQAERSAVRAEPLVLHKSLLDHARFGGIVLHPLPRRSELPADVDGHPAAKYFQQARNGVPVRMAVLEAVA